MVEAQNLIMLLLRIITPEEISDIATRHNGGKFLSLTALAVERFEEKVFRDFSDDEKIHSEIEEKSAAKILPFTKGENPNIEVLSNVQAPKVTHAENENMATFILIEKERLKKSQQTLKQREIIDLYRKNSHVDVEQIKQANQDVNNSEDAGILVNKKHY
jgi:hypothetical protein